MRTDYAQPADLDGQIQGILSRLSQDLNVWADISNHHQLDVFCGLWLRESNEMLGVSPQTLKALGDRNIQLELDIYLDDEQPLGSSYPVTK
jgi:hypothetical protein